MTTYKEQDCQIVAIFKRDPDQEDPDGYEFLLTRPEGRFLVSIIKPDFADFLEKEWSVNPDTSELEHFIINNELEPQSLCRKLKDSPFKDLAAYLNKPDDFIVKRLFKE